MTFTELFAAAFGLVGALLLATRSRHSGWGFLAFLASNICWLAFALERAHWPLVVQQVGFTLSSLFGIWVWIARPMWAEWRNERWDRQRERDIAAGAKAWREAGEMDVRGR